MNRRPLTILHVSTETGWRGGEQQVKLTAEGLAARGHTVKILSPPGAKLLEEASNEGMGIPLPIRLGEWDVFASRQIARAAREFQADLIHAQTSHAHSLALRAAKEAGVPLVVSRRVDFAVGRNWFSRQKYVDPVVNYIAVSRAIKEVLMQSGIGENRIHVVHSGVDMNRYPARGKTRDEELARHWGARAEVPLIVNAAALTDHKDQKNLLQAAALLKQSGKAFRLVIAGKGELEAELLALRKTLNLEDEVAFPGYVDLGLLYPAADLFVMSSHLEGLCTSILDAMSVGIPVVATRAGGIPEIVKGGENGLLVPPRDSAALAEAMVTLLSDAQLQESFRAAGRDTVRRGFTHSVMISGIEAAYYEILARAKGHG